MADNKINVGGRLHSIATGNILAGADEILDDNRGKKQSEVNIDVDNALANRYTKDETYNKNQLNNLITTPNQKYVTVKDYASLPESGEANIIYRVSSWDGSLAIPATDITKYSEYAWDGSQYIFLCVKSQIGEVYDISAANSEAKYADLAAALGTNGANVPSSIRKGGMSIKFVQSSDNKYVQYRLMADTFSTTVTDWQGIDDEPISESDDLVKSGGTQKSIVLGDSYIEGLVQPIEVLFKYDGFWYLNNGVLTKLTGQSCYYTDKITFLEGWKLDMIAAIDSSVGLVYMVFDANDNLIHSQVSQNPGGVTTQYNYTAPEGSAYIICCSKLTSNLIHCTIEKENNLSDIKFDKSNVINNLLEDGYNGTDKVLSYFWTQHLSNLFGYREYNKFINIYGNNVDHQIDGIDRYFSSAWIPINAFTKGKQLFGLVSQIAIGVAGLAFYSDFKYENFLGYYQPIEDDGVTRGDHVFDVFVNDAINSNDIFATAKYFRFTSKIFDFDNQNKKPILEISTDNSIKWIDNTLLKNDGTTYTFSDEVDYKTSDYILLNDVTKNMIIYGAASYARAGVYALCFYNINKEFVGTAYKHPDDDASTTMLKLCTISIKALMETSVDNSSYSYFRVCYDKRYGIKFATESVNNNLQSANDWDDRWALLRFNKIICIGDSVTQGFVTDYPIFAVESNHSYPTYLQKLMNSDVTNAGMSGDTPDEWYEGRDRGGTVHGSLYDQYFPDQTTDYDLAIIELGYNKGNGNDLIWSDLNVEHSNMWAYDRIITGIQSKNPKIEIVLIISSNAEFANNHSTESPIKQLAVKNNCKLIDLREDLTIHLDTEQWHGEFMDETDQQLHYDMVHFTAKGYTAKAALIYKKLIELYKE